LNFYLNLFCRWFLCRRLLLLTVAIFNTLFLTYFLSFVSCSTSSLEWGATLWAHIRWGIINISMSNRLQVKSINFLISLNSLSQLWLISTFIKTLTYNVNIECWSFQWGLIFIFIFTIVELLCWMTFSMSYLLIAFSLFLDLLHLWFLCLSLLLLLAELFLINTIFILVSPCLIYQCLYTIEVSSFPTSLSLSPFWLHSASLWLASLSSLFSLLLSLLLNFLSFLPSINYNLLYFLFFNYFLNRLSGAHWVLCHRSLSWVLFLFFNLFSILPSLLN